VPTALSLPATTCAPEAGKPGPGRLAECEMTINDEFSRPRADGFCVDSMPYGETGCQK